RGLVLEDNRRYWVGFNLVKGIGAVRLRALINAFGDVKSAWHASPEALRATALNPSALENLLPIRKSVSLDRVWEKIESQEITVLTWDDENYPDRLREIPSSPPVLYLRGEYRPDDEWAVAVVGTRKFTSYGRQITEEIVGTLALRGVTIESGLARGIDGIAHRVAIDAGGRTLAVMGSGVDRIYPPEHRRLADSITFNGALISDYPLGTAPEGSNFPPRNRIISGLSIAVIVIEAGKRSGALITASFAAEQGRDVFAVPGNINAPQSKGTNMLISKGAQPLLDPQDILESLDLTMVVEQRTARTVLPKDAIEAQLYNILKHEPLHVDDICSQTDLPIEKVTSTLALMELKGMVRQIGGMRYMSVREESATYDTEDQKDGH
ncbi:MAG: DNA-processing protein DprA, partial [Anaerolineales bacterium]